MTATRQQVLATVITNPQSAAPLNAQASFPAAYIGTAWTGLIYGSGGTGAYGYSVISKPAFVTATTSGNVLILTGTPGLSGSFVVDISDGASTQRCTFYISVLAAIAGGNGEVQKAQPAYTGRAYSFDPATLLNSTATLPLTSVTVSSGTLPTGMSIVSNVITASSVTGTTQDVTLTITDGASKVAVMPIRFTVSPALSFSTSTLPAAVIGHDYYAKLDITGGSGKYSVTAANPPAISSQGLSLNGATGEITGRATTLSPTTGALVTRFNINDLVTGQSITTSNLKVPVNSTAPSAPSDYVIATDPTGASVAMDVLAQFFGDGSDGDTTLDGTTNIDPTNFPLSGGTYRAARDLYFNNLTINGTAKLDMKGFRLYVAATLDITAAGAGAIQQNGVDGSSGGAGAVFGTDGGTAGTAGTGNGGNGGGSTQMYAGDGGRGGPGPITPASGGNGTGGRIGGNLSTAGIISNSPYQRGLNQQDIFWQVASAGVFAAVQVGGGTGGSGGGAGGGDGTNNGGVAGRGGGGAGCLFIAARNINRGASTAASCIQSKGGNGQNGSQGIAGNVGGGGAGCGGGGGKVRILAQRLLGSTATNAIDATAGNGGTGGALRGTGTAGVGGYSGQSGSILLQVMSSNTQTLVKGSGLNAPSGTTGATATLLRADL